MRFWMGLLLCTGIAFAQRPEVWTPLVGLYQIPSGTMPINQGCQLALSLSEINHLSYYEGDWGRINSDLEETRLEFQAKAKTEIGEFSLYLPLKLYWGGFLDPVLDVYHRAMNRLLGTDVDSNTVDRATDLWTDLAKNGNRLGLTQPALGLGDLILGYGLSLDPNTWLRFNLAVPVGRSEVLTGAGGWRSGVELGGTWGEWAGSVLFSVPLGEQSAYQRVGLKAQPNVGLKLRWEGLRGLLGSWFPVSGLQLNVLTSPIAIAGPYGSTFVSLHFLFSPGIFSEDLTSALPDVVLGYTSTFSDPNCWIQ